MIIVDSNVWIYYLDEEAPEHRRVLARLPKLLSEQLVVPAIVQLEVVHHIVRRMGARADDLVETFLALPATVAPVTGSVVAEAARLLLARRTTGIGGRDAALLVIARDARARIATADVALARAARAIGVTVVNPAK